MHIHTIDTQLVLDKLTNLKLGLSLDNVLSNQSVDIVTIVTNVVFGACRYHGLKHTKQSILDTVKSKLKFPLTAQYYILHFSFNINVDLDITSIQSPGQPNIFNLNPN